MPLTRPCLHHHRPSIFQNNPNNENPSFKETMRLTYAFRNVSPAPTPRPLRAHRFAATLAFIIRPLSNPRDDGFAIQLPYLLSTERVVVVGEVEGEEERVA